MEEKYIDRACFFLPAVRKKGGPDPFSSYLVPDKYTYTHPKRKGRASVRASSVASFIAAAAAAAAVVVSLRVDS